MNVFPRATSERFSRRPTVGKWLKPHFYAKTFSLALRRAGKLVTNRKTLFSSFFHANFFLTYRTLLGVLCVFNLVKFILNYSLIRDPKALCLLLVEGLSGLNVTLILTEDALSVYSFLLHSFSLN